MVGIGNYNSETELGKFLNPQYIMVTNVTLANMKLLTTLLKIVTQNIENCRPWNSIPPRVF